MRKIFFVAVIAVFSWLGWSANNAFTEDGVQPKSVHQLIDDLKGDDWGRIEFAKNELGKRGKTGAAALVAFVAEKTSPHRDVAVISLGCIRDPETLPFLIRCLDDQESNVRGRAAYAISQIGGDDAKSALVQFLERCLKNDKSNLDKATESVKELPDGRAFPSLLAIVDASLSGKSQGFALYYAVEALGKIGDARASGRIAKLLDTRIPYSESHDYLYLKAIQQTKGKDALPGLVAYLGVMLTKMEGHPEKKYSPADESLLMGIGEKDRQSKYNYYVWGNAVACLETVSGEKSEGATRSQVLRFWQRYLAQREDAIGTKARQQREGHADKPLVSP